MQLIEIIQQSKTYREGSDGYRASFIKALGIVLQNSKGLIGLAEKYSAFHLSRATDNFTPKSRSYGIIQTRNHTGSYLPTYAGREAKDPITDNVRIHGNVILADLSDAADADLATTTVSNSLLDQEIENLLRDSIDGLDNYLMTSDGLPLSDGTIPVKGLEYMLDPLQSSVYPNATQFGGNCCFDAGADLNSEAGFNKFIDLLEEEMEKVPGRNAILTTPKVFGHMKRRLVKRINASLTPSNTLFSNVGGFLLDDRLPVIPVTYLTDQEGVKGGRGGDKSSIYILNMGVGKTEIRTNGIDYMDKRWTEAQEKELVKWEFRLCIRINSEDSALRIHNIKT